MVAQLTHSARAAAGVGVAVLGFVYGLRAVGDTVEATGPSSSQTLGGEQHFVDAHLAAMLGIAGGGEHPEAAASRMRWALAGAASA